MHQGFIKVAAATPRIRVADVDFNAGAIIDSLKTAAQAGARLCVLPELVLTGYTCGDLFLQDTLLSSARRALEAIVDATANLDMISLIGLPLDWPLYPRLTCQITASFTRSASSRPRPRAACGWSSAAAWPLWART